MLYPGLDKYRKKVKKACVYHVFSRSTQAFRAIIKGQIRKGERMKKFSKEERLVVLGGVLLILAVVVLGLVKQTYIDAKKEPYHSILAKETAKHEQAKTTANMELKQSSFIYEVNTALNKKAAAYITASQTVLKKAKLDFAKVDMETPGTYRGSITYKQETLPISIIVKDSRPPVITTAHDHVPFTLEANSSVEEIKDYVDASAEDAYDGFIQGDQIRGWPAKLPKEAGTITYTLQVKDSSGNVGKKDITVLYTVKTQKSR